MKRSWMTGLVLFASLALNVTFGAMLFGRSVPAERAPIRVAMKRVAMLPAEDRVHAREVFERVKPGLQSAIEDLRSTRKDTVEYIQSDAFTREEADKRMSILQEKTTRVQAMAQSMMLDIVEPLAPEQRAIILNRD